MAGRTISKVSRVPVGRKLTSMEVFEMVFWTPLATARRLRPWSWSWLRRTRGRDEEGGLGLEDPMQEEEAAELGLGWSSGSGGSPYTALL